MSKVLLERRSGLSAKILGEFEKGRAVPSDDAVESLAACLQFPASFFYRTDLEEPSARGVSFRALKSMTAGQRDAALAAGALAFELSEWIDTHFQLGEIDVPDLRDYEAAEAALVLRNRWAIGVRAIGIGGMVPLLESKGIRVFSLSERAKQVDAYSLWYHDVPFVFLNTMKTTEHTRMDAAHELAHLVLHRRGARHGRDAENEAKVFAAEFLMPRASVVGLVNRLNGPSFNQLAQLKANWGVSLAALAMRLNRLGLLNDWAYRGICIELSKYGRAREPYGTDIRETSAVLAKVLSMAREGGTTRADIARHLDLYIGDLDALMFGLDIKCVDGGDRTKDAAAEERRSRFRVV
jgi:Zn-dependent peptidase ImmA (M78 family)